MGWEFGEKVICQECNRLQSGDPNFMYEAPKEDDDESELKCIECKESIYVILRKGLVLGVD